jgi:hypothetical protein
MYDPLVAEGKELWWYQSCMSIGSYERRCHLDAAPYCSSLAYLRTKYNDGRLMTDLPVAIPGAIGRLREQRSAGTPRGECSRVQAKRYLHSRRARECHLA